MSKVVKFLICLVACSCLQSVEPVEDADSNLFQRGLLCEYVPPNSCRTNIGRGTCLDADGEKFDACFKAGAGHVFFKSDCRDAAESTSNSVGWQYGALRAIPRVCVIFFDHAVVGDDVDIYCPGGFSRFEISGRIGTGFPNRTGDGLFDCYSCIGGID
ncbi:hypothetical protein FisN_18Hu064 [Fistulifera solaris]|uniref:Uncharacterized protein n=1 Tax=Fistulifera solaris TaxID=1519565 RepID=A0A1Z5JVW4_FISSO|nr:hypothetical protein FisN_18Hu064 [Fistulifera solaris]|eukprot:GAX17861.1 hypothetical protein FisN_18Hu064 [Fistulifera solaris]